VALEVAGRRLRGPVGAYAEGGDGEPAVIVGSTGRLEIFVRAGSARDNLGAGRGAIVRVRRAE
jgi:S-adenosylmethionine hydrolase